jgi:hypothetical protein
MPELSTVGYYDYLNPPPPSDPENLEGEDPPCDYSDYACVNENFYQQVFRENIKRVDSNGSVSTIILGKQLYAYQTTINLANQGRDYFTKLASIGSEHYIFHSAPEFGLIFNINSLGVSSLIEDVNAIIDLNGVTQSNREQIFQLNPGELLLRKGNTLYKKIANNNFSLFYTVLDLNTYFKQQDNKLYFEESNYTPIEYRHLKYTDGNSVFTVYESSQYGVSFGINEDGIFLSKPATAQDPLMFYIIRPSSI